MMTEALTDSERNAIFYPVNLSYIEDLATDISHTADGLGQAWLKLPIKAVRNIILTALKLTYIVNYRTHLYVHQKYVPELEIVNVMRGQITVPRFVRDMIREILRPMHHAGITYIPDIEIKMENTVDILNSFYPITEHLTRWRSVCGKLDYDMVYIYPEAVQSVCLTFCSIEKSEIYSFSSIYHMNWRIEAVARIKHLVHNPCLEVEETDKTVVSSAPKRKAQSDESQKSQKELKLYERIIEDNRILGMFIYKYPCHLTPTKLGYIGPTFRFPTEEEHSRTPPRTSFVEDDHRAHDRMIEKLKRAKRKNDRKANME